MAKLGFYNILTIECLSREVVTRKHQYMPLTKESAEQAGTVQEEQPKGAEEDGKAMKQQRRKKQK